MNIRYFLQLVNVSWTFLFPFYLKSESCKLVVSGFFHKISFGISGPLTTLIYNINLSTKKLFIIKH